MSNFWSLVGFEYKKIFSSKLNVILYVAVIIFVILLAFLNATGGFYFHSIGNADISTMEALKLDKETITANKGFVTDEVIAEAIMLAQNGYNNKDNYFLNSQGNEVLKPETQREFVLPYQNIYFFINNLYREKFNLTDGTKPIQYIDANIMTDFYKTYKQMLADNINQVENLTQNEKNKHLEMIEKIETPFYNEYAQSWFYFKDMSYYLGLILLTLLTVVLGNIFGKEYSSKADSIILSTKNGKTMVAVAKIVTAISFAVVSTVLIISCSLGTYIFVHGIDGLNVPLQFLGNYEYCTYPLTIGGFVAIVSAVILVTAITFSSFCAVVSAVFKSSVTSLSTLMICVFAPIFIPYINDRFLTQIVNCLFSRSFYHEYIFTRNFYTFGNVSFPPYIFYGILMSLTTLICIPIICKAFKNHQVN